MTDRANTPEEKIEVMLELYKLWLANSDMRLTQLIGNVYHYPSGIDFYNVEDKAFVRTLTERYKDMESTKPFVSKDAERKFKELLQGLTQ